MTSRGSVDTIDLDTMTTQLVRLVEQKEGMFPSFDHEQKDPRQDSIIVTRQHKHIIVEGLYVLMD